jgi:hypothetical protein
VASPALIDLLGFDFAHEGHTTALLFAELLDFSRMNVGESDKACQIEILAHFDDGFSHAIDVLRRQRKHYPFPLRFTGVPASDILRRRRP